MIDEGRARTQAMLRAVVGADAPAAVVRGYQVLTGLSSHSFSAMRELFGMPRVFATCQRNGGEVIAVLFDYGHFTVVYEAVTNHLDAFHDAIVNGGAVKTTLEDSLDDLKLFAQIGKLFADEARAG